MTEGGWMDLPWRLFPQQASSIVEYLSALKSISSLLHGQLFAKQNNQGTHDS